jgi:pimeloyl-ACP methyl ester carboxylesterase
MEEVRHAPDEEWCADTLIKLTRGVTAYRLDLPETSDDATQDHIPLVVCLHDICNASYMWKDLSHLLTHIKTGPPARVLVLDFYGNGRSPWCEGVTCTMDIFVFQVKELLYKLGISQEKYPFTVVGQGFGAAVAAGFAARNPHFVQSVVLMNPAGIQYNESFLLESTLRLPLLGRWLWQRSIVHKVEETVVAQYHDARPSAAHYKLVKKDIDMLKWQFNYTPGFLGALHSKLSHFPLRNDALFEMYSAMGMHPNRDMLVLVGDDDRIFGSNGGDSRRTTEGGGERRERGQKREDWKAAAAAAALLMS